MGINRTAKTWGSELLTSSDLNAEVKNLWTGLQASWTSYTPTWTSSGTAPAVGNGSIVGKYFQMGKTIHYNVTLTLGTTSTLGTGVYAVTLPVAAARSTYFPVGVGVMYNSGSTQWHRTAILVSSSAAGLISEDGTRWSNTSPFTMGDADQVMVSGTYEAA